MHGGGLSGCVVQPETEGEVSKFGVRVGMGAVAEKGEFKIVGVVVFAIDDGGRGIGFDGQCLGEGAVGVATQSIDGDGERGVAVGYGNVLGMVKMERIDACGVLCMGRESECGQESDEGSCTFHKAIVCIKSNMIYLSFGCFFMGWGCQPTRFI